MDKKAKMSAYISLFSIIPIMLITVLGLIFCQDKQEIINESVEAIKYISTYEVSDSEIEKLPSTVIEKQTDEEILAQEQVVEDEGFELQGEIAYEGAKARSWNVELGNTIQETYFSQLDSRWANIMYSSTGNASQTIGSSGCGPTCASMVVTATKGLWYPYESADVFNRYGYRSASQGTYWSAFRAVADQFEIGYTETTNIDRAIELLRNNNYVIASCGNGLFTTGGHFIVLAGIEGNTIKIYDPYLYAGKFDTSTRRGKVSQIGNVVYCSVDNFKNYANASGFFAYQKTGNAPVNTGETSYTMYVKANGGLNVRNSANGTKIGILANGTAVTVYEVQGNWSRISQGWVCNTYLVSNTTTQKVISTSTYTIGTYRVNASVLNVRTGINYTAKKYYQLTANARQQNSRLGNYYTNGYKKGVVCTVTKVNGSWGYTASGWICLSYCTKI